MATDPELVAFEVRSREAIRLVECIRCFAGPGELCRSRGKDREVSHADRVRSYQEEILEKASVFRKLWKKLTG